MKGEPLDGEKCGLRGLAFDEAAMHSDDHLFIDSLWPTPEELDLRRTRTESLLERYDSDSIQSGDQNEVTFDAMCVTPNILELQREEEEEDNNTEGRSSGSTPMIALIEPHSHVFRVVRPVRTNEPATIADDQTQESIVSKSAKTFPCKFCGKILSKPSALGGHVSRVHHGMSETREMREKIRISNDLIKKLLSHLEEPKEHGKDFKRFERAIRKRLMALDKDCLHEQNLVNWRQSTWFINLEKGYFSIRNKDIS